MKITNYQIVILKRNFDKTSSFSRISKFSKKIYHNKSDNTYERRFIMMDTYIIPILAIFIALRIIVKWYEWVERDESNKHDKR